MATHKNTFPYISIVLRLLLQDLAILFNYFNSPISHISNISLDILVKVWYYKLTNRNKELKMAKPKFVFMTLDEAKEDIKKENKACKDSENPYRTTEQIYESVLAYYDIKSIKEVEHHSQIQTFINEGCAAVAVLRHLNEHERITRNPVAKKKRYNRSSTRLSKKFNYAEELVKRDVSNGGYVKYE